VRGEQKGVSRQQATGDREVDRRAVFAEFVKRDGGSALAGQQHGTERWAHPRQAMGGRRGKTGGDHAVVDFASLLDDDVFAPVIHIESWPGES